MPLAVMAVLLGIWEAAVRLLKVPLYILPAPGKIFMAMIEEADKLIHHSTITLAETVAGLAIAMISGVMLGIFMDRYIYLKKILYPLLVISQNVPILVLAPIFIIYLGFGMAPKLAVIVLMCFFPITVNLMDGLETVNQGQVNLARMFGATEWQIYMFVKLPAAASGLFSGLRVAATYSITGAIVGEWLASQAGLGYYMLRVKNAYMLDKVFACILCIVILSMGMNGLVKLAEYFLMPGLKANKKGMVEL